MKNRTSFIGYETLQLFWPNNEILCLNCGSYLGKAMLIEGEIIKKNARKVYSVNSMALKFVADLGSVMNEIQNPDEIS